MSVRIIKAGVGTPNRGEVREFYRKLATHVSSEFVDGGAPIFLLKLPSGQCLTILLGTNVSDLHKNLDKIMELLICMGSLPPSPYPDQHTIP